MITIKEAYYFSHDSNARNDPKILAMRSKYGYEGYGWFWALVEMMREQDDYKLPMQPQCMWNAYALQLQCTEDAVHKFVEDCINEFKLFASDGEYFWSESLLKRMKRKEEKAEKARAAALSRWSNRKSKCNADALQTHSDCNAIKENKNKINNIEEEEDNIRARGEAEVFKFYQENIGLISPHQAEVIGSFLEDGLSPGLIIEIFKDSLGKSDKWSWAKRVMQNCLAENILTAEQYAAKKVERQNEAEKAKSRDSPGKSKKQPFIAKEIYT